MSKIEIETERNPTISGLDAKNRLEIEDPRIPTVSGEQTNVAIKTNRF